jgi:amino acid transporter
MQVHAADDARSSIINVFAVKWYGESEFWLSMGKVILATGLICYTFVTMLGGNPLGDRYGFRFWRDPGSFAEYYKTGDLGRFLGFLQCLIQASFTIAGPDYVSMSAGEAENPRVVMPKAFNAVFYRLTTFFVLGALCVGINVPYDDKTLEAALKKTTANAAASPYVISMLRLRIQVLPDIVNALILSAAFSAGNSYVYCASRSLFGLALEGKAPKIFTKCTKNGVPIYCVALVLGISLLSFLQVSNNAAIVLKWFINLVSLGVRYHVQRREKHFMLTIGHRAGHCFSTDQLLRHELHVPSLYEGLQSAGALSGRAPS